MTKKILIISESSVYTDANNAFISRGGGASCVHNIAKACNKDGHEVSVFSLREFSEQKEFEIIDGVKYIRSFSSDRSSFKLIKYLFLAKKYSIDFDLIFVNQFLPHLLLPFLRKSKKIALIHDVYLNNFTFWFRQFGLFKGLIGYFVEFLQLFFDKFFADRILVVSKSTENKIRNFLGKSILKKIFLIPNSIDLKEYSSLKKEKYLLFVGRFVSYKRPFDLLDVLFEVNKKFPEYSAKFVMTRDFSEIVDKVKKRANELGVKNFELINKVSDKKLKQFFSQASLLVQPSLIEGQGIVVLEALASGTAVCAYNLEAYLNMLINGENCELARAGDVQQLSLNAIKMLENLEFYNSNTSKTLADFDIGVFKKNVQDIIRFE